MWMVMHELFRNDELLADHESNLYSVRPEMQDTPTNPTGFELFSDRDEIKFPTYELGDNLRLIPGPDTPTVKFSWLKDLLLSKDLARNSELEWASKELRFLDGLDDLTGNRISFVSFPRTGNTMTRGYLETLTGIHTGSSMDLILTSSFQISGMGGEDHVCDDKDVWITKTHWPNGARKGFLVEREFWTDRAIIITRNPIDVLVSLFYMGQLASHSMTCVEKINEAFAPEWDNYIRVMIPIFKAYHNQVIETIAKDIPAYFFRYEDQTTKALETTIEFCKVIMD